MPTLWADYKVTTFISACRVALWAWGKSVAHLSFSEFDVNKVSRPKKIGALLSFGPNLDSVCRQTNLDRELYLARDTFGL